MASAGCRKRTSLPSTCSVPPVGLRSSGEDAEELVLALALQRHEAQHLAGWSSKVTLVSRVPERSGRAARGGRRERG